MGMDRIKARVRKTVELTNVMKRTPSSEWDQAVRNAASHMNDGWILPETKCDPASAEELAALLCAYGA